MRRPASYLACAIAALAVIACAATRKGTFELPANLRTLGLKNVASRYPALFSTRLRGSMAVNDRSKGIYAADYLWRSIYTRWVALQTIGPASPNCPAFHQPQALKTQFLPSTLAGYQPDCHSHTTPRQPTMWSCASITRWVPTGTSEGSLPVFNALTRLHSV